MSARALTNTSAMVAPQTLRSTNTKLNDVQSQISTGKAVGAARDNASIFAISKVMESGVSGFTAATGSLSLGGSTIAVASNGAFQIGEILNDIKAKIVSANGENVDRQKLQDGVASLRGQLANLSKFTRSHTRKVLRQEADAAILIEINTAVMRGLRGQLPPQEA